MLTTYRLLWLALEVPSRVSAAAQTASQPPVAFAGNACFARASPLGAGVGWLLLCVLLAGT